MGIRRFNDPNTGRWAPVLTHISAVLGTDGKNLKTILEEIREAKVTFENLTEDQRAQLKGLPGEKGDPGDSVIVGEGDLPLSNVVNSDDNKAVTPKAVLDYCSVPISKINLLYDDVTTSTFTWGGKQFLKASNGTASTENNAGSTYPNSVTKYNIEGASIVKFNASKGTRYSSGNYIIWAITDSNNAILSSSDSYPFGTSVALQDYEQVVPENAKYLYISAKTADTGSIYVTKTNFYIPKLIQDNMDALDGRLDTAEGAISTNATAINNNSVEIDSIKSDIHGFTKSGFTANALISTANATYGNNNSADGYARSPFISTASNLGTLTLKKISSFRNIYFFAYNSSTTTTHATCVGFKEIDKTFNPQQIIEEEEWLNVVGFRLSITVSPNTALNSDTVGQWYLERSDVLDVRISAIESELSTNTADTNKMNSDLYGFTETGFKANKYIVTGPTAYGNHGSANGYALGPIMDISKCLCSIEIKGVGSFREMNLFAYSSLTVCEHSTCLGFVSLGLNRVFDVRDIVEQKNWQEAKAIQLSLWVGSSALNADTVSNNWYLKRADSINGKLDTMESSIATLQEQVGDTTGTAKIGVFHYNATAGGTSYVSSDLDGKNIKASFKISRTPTTSNNPCFTFTNVTLDGTAVHSCGEEITPSRFNKSYQGGNHGDTALMRITCENHGKTYSDIGSIWTAGGKDYTIVYITNENTLYVIGENKATYPKCYFEQAITGEYVHKQGATNTASFTVSDVAALSDNQLRSAMEMAGTAVYVDGKQVTESGDYPFSKLEICENYDILNTASIVDKLQEAAGTFEDNPKIYELGADKAARHSLVYTFVGADLWFVNKTLTFYQSVRSDSGDESLFMMNQLISGSSIKLYIPKAVVSINGTDIRSISNFSSLGSEVNIPTAAWENPLLPPDRYLQYSTAIGLSSGYLFDYGIGGNNRKDCISNAFYLPTTRKVYPIGIDAASVTCNAGDSYSAVCFRKYFIPSSIDQNGVICNTVFEYDDKLYIYADYNAAGIYEIDIPSKYLGRNVEVFEKRDNVELLTKISSSKLLVKVNEVEENDVMYGYLVAQIK